MFFSANSSDFITTLAHNFVFVLCNIYEYNYHILLGVGLEGDKLEAEILHMLVPSLQQSKQHLTGMDKILKCKDEGKGDGGKGHAVFLRFPTK